MIMENERPNKGKGGGITIYSDSFKVQVALEYLDGNYSCPQIARKYNIPVNRAQYFVYWYRHVYQSVMEKEPEKTEDAPLSSSERKDLERKLAMAEMKIAALEKVIAIANQEYRTDLKKKAATK
jgi:transposase-like protein